MGLKNSSNSANNNAVLFGIIGALAFIVIAMFTYILLGKTANQANTIATPNKLVASSATPANITSGQSTNSTISSGDAREGMAIGKYTGNVPEVFKLLDEMGGFKEDPSVAIEDTVYIIYDPRCPYCHSLYDKIRTSLDLKAKGITIKWLPTVALGIDGDSDPSIAKAAYALTAKNINDFGSMFGDSAVIPQIKVTDEQKATLNNNLNFLKKASDQTFGENQPKSVPAVFFLDKKTGTPQMLYGATEDATFINIFGR